MRGMNSETVDLIYLDPPFNSNTNYAAPIGSEAAGAEFKDTWTLNEVDIAWLDLIEAKHPKLNKVIHAAMTSSDKSYLIYMAVRLLEMKRLLKPTGSIYLHCDSVMSHYLKLVMDAIFGRDNFRNEIAWCYGGRGAKAIAKQFPRNKDMILFYSVNFGQHHYKRQFLTQYFSDVEAKKKGYMLDSDGRWFKTSPKGDYTDKSINTLREQGRIYTTRNGTTRIKYFLNVKNGKVTNDVLVGDAWDDIPDAMHMKKSERTGYPTQKPLALLHRIINASSHEEDVIFDPFCGCATACIAAEGEGRNWIGIDISPKAAELVKSRTKKELGGLFQGIVRDDVPARTDVYHIRRYNHPDNKKMLYGEQGGHCNGCGEHFMARNLTIDHIIPQSKGGTDHLSNLQLLCGHCNSVKGNRGQEYLVAKLAA